MLVHEFLTSTAARLPNKTALICGDLQLTYGDLDRMTNRLAQGLVREGVKPGDRVAIHLPNTHEAVIGIFAVLKAGGVFVFVNASTRPAKLRHILNDCRATAIILGGRGGQDTFQDLRGTVPSLRFGVVCGEGGPAGTDGLETFEGLLEREPADALGVAVQERDLACLVYTSGSTGEPKGVMSEHGNVSFASASIISYLENREDDVVLCVLPLSFDYGLYQLLMTFRFGGTLVLERSFAFPAQILQRIQEERVTGFPGVPTVFAMLLGMDLRSFDLSSLRYITNTAAALAPAHCLSLRQAFPGVVIYSMYGLTETKRTLYLPPDQLAIRPGSVGIPIPGTEAWLEDEAGKRLDPGATGELVIRGPHVMRGYWEAPEATAARFPVHPILGERVCRSGDLFRQDEEGYFYFVARKDDIIKCLGEKVAPKEVEQVLHMLPGVLAAVVGVPDPIAGEVVKAFIQVSGPALTAREVMAHCRANLEDYMVPRYIEFVDSLPLTASGKVNKAGLRKEVPCAESSASSH